MGVAERERLGDRERAVGEVGVGRDDGQVDPVARQRAQGEQGLEARDAAAGDDDVHPPHRTPCVTGNPQP